MHYQRRVRKRVARNQNRPDLPVDYTPARGDVHMPDPKIFDDIPKREAKDQRLHVRLTASKVRFLKSYARLSGQGVTQVIEQLIDNLEESVAQSKQF